MNKASVKPLELPPSPVRLVGRLLIVQAATFPFGLLFRPDLGLKIAWAAFISLGLGLAMLCGWPDHKKKLSARDKIAKGQKCFRLVARAAGAAASLGAFAILFCVFVRPLARAAAPAALTMIGVLSLVLGATAVRGLLFWYDKEHTSAGLPPMPRPKPKPDPASEFDPWQSPLFCFGVGVAWLLSFVGWLLYYSVFGI